MEKSYCFSSTVHVLLQLYLKNSVWCLHFAHWRSLMCRQIFRKNHSVPCHLAWKNKHYFPLLENGLLPLLGTSKVKLSLWSITCKMGLYFLQLYCYRMSALIEVLLQHTFPEGFLLSDYFAVPKSPWSARHFLGVIPEFSYPGYGIKLI